MKKDAVLFAVNFCGYLAGGSIVIILAVHILLYGMVILPSHVFAGMLAGLLLGVCGVNAVVYGAGLAVEYLDKRNLR